MLKEQWIRLKLQTTNANLPCLWSHIVDLMTDYMRIQILKLQSHHYKVTALDPVKQNE